MPIRITGMNSGLDTESIISELVKAKSAKKDDLVKAQTKLQWKQDAWKELNSKVYSLYSKTLSNMRLVSDYTKKATKVSNESAVTVITGAAAVNGVQTLKIEQLAKTGYLTGAELKNADGEKAQFKSTTNLKELGVKSKSELELKVGDETTEITISEDMTIGVFVSTLQKAGLNASFDEKNQRFFISAKESGEKADFALFAKDEDGMNALQSMGIAAPLDKDNAVRAEYEKYCVYDEENSRWVVNEEEQTKRILEEREKRKEQFGKAKKEIGNVEADLQTYKDKYGESIVTTSLADIEKELASKKKKLEKSVKLEEDERKKLEEEIKDLETKITDKKKVDELKAQSDELQNIIKENEQFLEITEDGKVELKEGKLDDFETATREPMVAEFEFAAKVLNGGFPSTGATRVSGENSKITLNDAEFTSAGNNFEINGLTITVHAETQQDITLTTSNDTEGIYDMIKNFLKEYNELINEMDKLYNADSSKGYEPLTDEEKEAMSEKEVEKWEEKIKNSILRRDSTLSSVATAMKQVMMQGVKMKDETQLYLSEFGIGTLGYFSAKDNEKNAYHIDGDKDDASTATNVDKLKAAIANDPNKVIEFFSSLSKNLYEKLGDMMKKTEYSSSFTLYDDVAMKEDYDDYTSKIKSQEQKITAFEDRYYKKFSAMETALAKMSSKESAISGLLGM